MAPRVRRSQDPSGNGPGTNERVYKYVVSEIINVVLDMFLEINVVLDMFLEILHVYKYGKKMANSSVKMAGTWKIQENNIKYLCKNG